MPIPHQIGRVFRWSKFGYQRSSCIRQLSSSRANERRKKNACIMPAYSHTHRYEQNSSRTNRNKPHVTPNELPIRLPRNWIQIITLFGMWILFRCRTSRQYRHSSECHSIAFVKLYRSKSTWSAIFVLYANVSKNGFSLAQLEKMDNKWVVEHGDDSNPNEKLYNHILQNDTHTHIQRPPQKLW